MMEFVLSRVWMVIAGLAITAVLLAVFAGLDHSISDQEGQAGARTLARMIDALEDEGGSAEMRVEVDELITGQGTSLVVRPGSIWIEDGRTSEAVACSGSIVLFDDGHRVDSLQLARGDVVIIRSSAGQVQLEKVSAM